MDIHDFTDPLTWAAHQWEQAELGDARRTARTVRLGAALAVQPGASLPAQAGSWGDLKAAYRLLNETDVTHQALSGPHWQATRAQATETNADVVLFIQDTTELDFTGHRHTQGLGHIGDAKGAGLLLHSCLALLPDSGSAPGQNSGSAPTVLGVAAQKVWTRPPVSRGKDGGPVSRGKDGGKETRTQRHERPTEADVWAEIVEAIGPAPAAGPLWVSVADRGSDVFSYLRRSQAQGWHCLVRLCQDRLIETPDGTPARLKGWLRSLPAQAHKKLILRGRDGAPGQTVRLSVSWSRVAIQAPAQGPERKQPPVIGCCLRCWEEAPDKACDREAPDKACDREAPDKACDREAPDKACDREAPDKALEWLLFATVPVMGVADAWQTVDWYACRWVIEEYHKCLKSGCSVERRQLRTVAGLQALVGLLAVVAIRLLQLRTLSRHSAHLPAQAVLPPAMLQILASRFRKPPASMTLGEFWRALAGLGGFLGRKSDGSPGWQTLWRGWQRLQDMCWGAEVGLGDTQKCG